MSPKLKLNNNQW